MTDTKKMLAKGHAEFGLAELPSNEETAMALKAKYADLGDVETKVGYERHRVAQGELTKFRTAIEKRRKELKAEHLEAGRRIDEFAKHWTEFILAIETPIRTAKALVDEREEMQRIAKENEERKKQEEEARARLAAEEATRRAERDAEEARLKAIRDAENDRLRIESERLAAERAKAEAEQKIERERIAAERKALEESQRIEREKVAAERAEIERRQRLVAEEQERIAKAQEEERLRIERLEFERVAKIKAEQEAKEKIERERIEADQRKAAKELADKIEAERIDAMRSDVEHVHAYAEKFAAFPFAPIVKSKEAKAAVANAYNAVINAGEVLARFAK